MIRFVSNILPYVPECPAQLIKAEILRVAAEFCRRTYVWQEEKSGTVTDGGEYYMEMCCLGIDDTIELEPTAGEVIGIKLLVNDREISDFSRSGTTITLDSDLSEDDEVVITMYLSPERDATELPDVLYTDWLEGISAGVRANLMLMQGKPWFNPGMASAQLQTYNYQVGQASLAARKRNAREPQHIQMRPWI